MEKFNLNDLTANLNDGDQTSPAELVATERGVTPIYIAPTFY